MNDNILKVSDEVFVSFGKKRVKAVVVKVFDKSDKGFELWGDVEIKIINSSIIVRCKSYQVSKTE